MLQELKKVLLMFRSGLSFVIYFIIAIIGFGCWGFWVELTKLHILNDENASDKDVMIALGTIFPALIGPTTLYIIYQSIRKNNLGLSSFGILVLLASFICALFIEMLNEMYPDPTFYFAIILTILAMALWIFTYRKDPVFYDDLPKPDIPIGGDPSRKLQGRIEKGFQQ